MNNMLININVPYALLMGCAPPPHTQAVAWMAKGREPLVQRNGKKKSV